MENLTERVKLHTDSRYRHKYAQTSCGILNQCVVAEEGPRTETFH